MVQRRLHFTQEDPIGVAGGLNLYGYAGGDPINFSDPFGLCAQSTGTDTLETRSAHLSEMCVSEGEYVEAGQLIGYSGKTGSRVTGAHLHFETRRNGVSVDPLDVLSTGDVPPVEDFMGTMGSPFGQRVDPITGGIGNHRGIDFRVSEGTPVYAVRAGRVTRASYSTTYGNVVYIQHTP